jgi:hypothetical protein
MVGPSWRRDLDRQATIQEYCKAMADDNYALAKRIKNANPDIEWHTIEEVHP